MYQKQGNPACGSRASNVVHLRQNTTKTILTPPKKQEVSLELEEAIMLGAVRKCMKWHETEGSDTSRWLLRIASHAYRTEGTL